MNTNAASVTATENGIELVTSTGLMIEASDAGFVVVVRHVVRRQDGSFSGFHDSTYRPCAIRGKRAVAKASKAFYAWLRLNEEAVTDMTLSELCAQWKTLGVQYDYR